MQVVTWAKDHPALAIGGGFVAVVLFMLLFRGHGGGGDNGAGAYYAAQAAQAQSNDAVAIAQIQETGNTARTLIAAGASVQNNQTWAATDLASTQSNNATEAYLAPFTVQQSLIGALGDIAAKPGGENTTTTSSKKGGGLLGSIFGGKSKTTTTTTYTPDPAATQAATLLTQLWGSSAQTTGLIAAH